MTLDPFCLIIGGHRCGTTSLYRYLIEAGICKAGNCKEPGYFGNPKIHIIHPKFERTVEYYEKHRQIGEGPWFIDATVAYLQSKTAPERVYNYNANAKPIALLRNPVDRNWSAYWQHPLIRLLETPCVISYENFKDLKTAADYRQFHMNYIPPGIYVYGLDRWVKWFPNMLIIKSEDMFNAPHKIFNQVCEYMGAEPKRIPEFKVHNPAAKGKQPADIAQMLTKVFRPYNALLKEKYGISWP